MIEKFIHHLKQFIELNDADIEFVKEIVSVKRLQKGDYLLQEGAFSQAFYFNISGFVRLFYLIAGEEKTAYFYSEGIFISAYASFVKQLPSRFYLQATETTHVAVISMEASVQLLNYSSKFEKLARIAMEEELIKHQEMVESLITLSPEERYHNLLQKNPTIFNRVPQIQIASYIGVKPESLSRIKKRSQLKS